MPVIAPQAPQLTKPWNTCGVDADHQRDVGSAPGDMLGGVAQRFRAAEFLEADEMGKALRSSKNSSARVSKP